ncbi:MAG: TonB-dependent receptor plug domain-containing protein [Bacteroidetes bacterium]|nr:TonB-dependent receptor plug domain-containing protein [Bacteroidota bacterium]
MVIGYGTVKRTDLTGSVTSISSKEISESKVMNIDQALQGRMAGVQVSSKGGKPGANMSVQIRGFNSPKGNEPLYVIDGIPVGNGANAEYNSDRSYDMNSRSSSLTKFELSSINPADIESIDVLKDASSTAIYGARAANGVVVITTKKGKKGEPSISLNTSYGVQSITKKIEMMNSTEFLNAIQDAYIANGQSRSAKIDTLLKRNYYNTNWQDEVYKKAPQYDMNLSVSGGSNNLTYFTSISYSNQDGLIEGDASGYKKYTLKANVENQVRKWLKIGVSLNGAKTSSGLVEATSGFGPTYDALAGWPIIPVRWNPGDDNIFGFKFKDNGGPTWAVPGELGEARLPTPTSTFNKTEETLLPGLMK